MNELSLGKAKSGKKNVVEISTILQNDVMKTKLQGYIDETIRAKTKILDQQDHIRGIKESAIEELNVDPKMFNTLVSLFFNNNFDQKLEELEKLDEAIRLIQGKQE